MPKYKKVDTLAQTSIKLKTGKRQSQYKSDMQYVNAVYRKNKELINRRIDQDFVQLHGTPNKAFNALVKEKMADINFKTGKNYTAKEAIKSVNNSLAMLGDYNPDKLTGMELRKQKLKYIKGLNFKSLLKKDKELWKEFRMNELRNKGKFAEYDPAKLQFLGYYQDGYGNCAVYQYGDTVIIERKSPKRNEEGEEIGASIEMISKFDFDNMVGKTMFEDNRRR